jgi:hypothetical protein
MPVAIEITQMGIKVSGQEVALQLPVKRNAIIDFLPA